MAFSIGVLTRAHMPGADPFDLLGLVPVRECTKSTENKSFGDSYPLQGKGSNVVDERLIIQD
eukprot:1116685-Ditylum_brightwellii.AAC.1